MELKKLLTETEVKELNKFGQFELTASHTYMHLSNRMKSLGYFGAEAFFSGESDDEREHYRKLEEFMNNMNAELEVMALDPIKTNITDIQGALELAYEMEEVLLEEYERVYASDVSSKVKTFLQEFINFQVKAVGEYGDLINRLKLTNDMLVFDADLLERSENEG